MKDELKRIEDKIDKHSEQLSDISKTLAVNTQSLVDHIAGVKQTRQMIGLQRDEMNKRLIPIEKHVIFINALAKILTVLLSAVLAAKEFNFF